MAKYYVDTCIWIDFMKRRHDGKNSLGEYADRFIQQAILKGDVLLYSDLTIYELSLHVKESDVFNLFSSLVARGAVAYVKMDYSEKQQAIHISEKLNIPFGDALHALLTWKEKAVLVTRDKHFNVFKKEIVVRTPEELL